MTTFLAIVIGLSLVIALILVAGHLYTRSIAAQVAQAIRKTGKETGVRGGRIHWIEKGDGPPILMIHGLGGNHLHYDYALMDRLAPEFRCISIDRPGCGFSSRDGAALAAIPEQARMIAEFLEKEGVEKPLVVGHSLGGAVALALALDHPQRVGALALLAPLTHQAGEPPAVFKPLVIENGFMRRLISQTIAIPLAIRNAEAALAAVFAPETAPVDFPVRAGGLLGLRPKGFVAPSEDIVAVPPSMEKLTPRLSSLSVPGGVLYGDRDQILDPKVHGEGLAKAAPTIELELIEGAGHMLPMTRADDCVAFIRRMAQKAAQPGAAAIDRPEAG